MPQRLFAVPLHKKLVAESVKGKMHDFLHKRSRTACVYIYNQ